MKLLSTLIASASIALFTLPAAADVRFGIMNEPLPPLFSKNASGQWNGFEIDIMNAICVEMKEKCSIVDMSWDGLIPGLLTKKFDVIWSNMMITNERKKRIDFTDKYYSTPSKMIGAKNGKMGVSPSDVKGKTIGVQVSTIQAEYYKKYFANLAEVKIYSTLDEADQDLAAGRIDYVFADAIALNEFLKSDLGKQCCENKGDVKHDREILGFGIGAGLRKEDTKLRDKINMAIKAIRANGKYEQISKKYFNFNPYGD